MSSAAHPSLELPPRQERRKRFFSDRQVAGMINIPAALGLPRLPFHRSLFLLPIKKGLSELRVVLVACERLCRAGAASPPSLLPPAVGELL